MPITSEMPRQGSTFRTSRTGCRRGRQAAGFLVVVALAGLLAPNAALGSESSLPTTQAKAYGAEWVPYLDPPAKPAAVCLVDTGVNITPDTPADSPDGPILERSALDGGTGEAAGTSWEELHGTRMAMAAVAPLNGWGTVGFAPGVRIVSIRAMPRGQTTFPFDDYRRAIDQCVWRSARYNVVAVVLALGCSCTRTAAETDALENKVAQARRVGISVVASAGNSAGAVGSPANLDGVVAVGAADSKRVLCAFSNRGPEIDATGPGCGLDLADPTTGHAWSGWSGGTSAAALTIASALALVRGHAPSLDRARAESAILGTRPALDLRDTFIRADLGSLVTAATERMSRVEAVGATGGEHRNDAPIAPQAVRVELDGGSSAVPPLPAPRRVRAQWTAGRLRVAVANRPTAAMLHIRAVGGHREFGRARGPVISRLSDEVRLRIRWMPRLVLATFIERGLPLQRSRTVRVWVRK